MMKWDYCVIVNSGLSGYVSFLGAQRPGRTELSEEEIHNYIAILGRQGWELTAAINRKSKEVEFDRELIQVTEFYFKRPGVE